MFKLQEEGVNVWSVRGGDTHICNVVRIRYTKLRTENICLR